MTSSTSTAEASQSNTLLRSIRRMTAARDVPHLAVALEHAVRELTGAQDATCVLRGYDSGTGAERATAAEVSTRGLPFATELTGSERGEAVLLEDSTHAKQMYPRRTRARHTQTLRPPRARRLRRAKQDGRVQTHDSVRSALTSASRSSSCRRPSASIVGPEVRQLAGIVERQLRAFRCRKTRCASPRLRYRTTNCGRCRCRCCCSWVARRHRSVALSPGHSSHRDCERFPTGVGNLQQGFGRGEDLASAAVSRINGETPRVLTIVRRRGALSTARWEQASAGARMAAEADSVCPASGCGAG